MADPEGYEIGRQAEASSVRIGPCCEMLQANECNPASCDNQLAGVSAADADHQVQVYGSVDLKQVFTARQRVCCDFFHVYALQQRIEIAAPRLHCLPHHLFRW